MPNYRDLELASDGTGRKTSHAGEYRIFRYGDPEARQRKHLVMMRDPRNRVQALLCMMWLLFYRWARLRFTEVAGERVPINRLSQWLEESGLPPSSVRVLER